MKQLKKRHSEKAGLAPGTIVHIGRQKTGDVGLTAIDYDSQNFSEYNIENLEQIRQLKTTSTISWLNIDGLHDTEIIGNIGESFSIHSLSLEDIANTTSRPKTEFFDNYVFIVLKMLTFNSENAQIESEQVSLILGENYVLSFQEHAGDVFGNIRQRLSQNKGRIRKLTADYLLYSLIDAIVDNYFAILEAFGEIIEQLEEELINNPSNQTLQKIHGIKQQMVLLRKSVWPMREVVSMLRKNETQLITDNTQIYMADVYDHTVQIIDTVEASRDMVAGMMDLYLSSLSNKMNSVMKVLTIIATIFIPLGFFAGVYGMNFKYMPELNWKLAYPIGFWVVVVLIVISMLYFFKRKNWL